MVGWLGELQTYYAKWVRDNVIGGTLTMDSPFEEGEVVVLEIDKASVKTRPEVNGDKIAMKIKGKAAMSVAEVTNFVRLEAYDEDVLRKLEDEAEKKLEQGIKDTIRYVQREYGADIFHFSLAMKRYAPKEWRKVKEKWHEAFSQVEAMVEMDVRIADTGLTK
jgi:hypothetical protein